MKRILLVESDPCKAADVVQKLTTQNYWVEHVGSFAGVLEKLGECPGYSCIVASYEMPEAKGTDLIRRIRTFDQRIGVVVLADEPATAEAECDGLDIMAVVPRRSSNGILLEKVRDAIEIGEIPEDRYTKISHQITSESCKLREMQGS